MRPSKNKILSFEELVEVKQYLLNNLNNNIKLIGLENEYINLNNLVKRSIVNKENNSCIVVGPKGSGKSLLIDSILKEFIEQRDQNIKSNRLKFTNFRVKITKQAKVINNQTNNQYNHLNFKIVRLNGSIQTNDKLALKEILKQLKLEEKFNMCIKGNLKDLLLREANQQYDSDDEDLIELNNMHLMNEELELKGAFSEIMKTTLELINDTNSNYGKCTVVFVLEDFDQFAHANKQTLLYNLFDMVQGSQSTSLAVIGITNRIDVLNLLEKRVKSRFSHRLIYTFPMTYTNYKQIISNICNIGLLETNLTYKKLFLQTHEELLNNSDFENFIYKLYQISPDPSRLKNIMYTAITRLSTDFPFLSMKQFKNLIYQVSQDPISQIFKGFTNLELYLLVAIKKLSDLNFQWINFEMVYDVYSKRSYQTTGNIDRIILFDKSSALRCIDQFLAMELIQLQSQQSIKSTTLISKHYRYFRLLIEPSMIPVYIKQLTDCPDNILRWISN